MARDLERGERVYSRSRNKIGFVKTPDPRFPHVCWEDYPEGFRVDSISLIRAKTTPLRPGDRVFHRMEKVDRTGTVETSSEDFTSVVWDTANLSRGLPLWGRYRTSTLIALADERKEDNTVSVLPNMTPTSNPFASLGTDYPREPQGNVVVAWSQRYNSTSNKIYSFAALRVDSLGKWFVTGPTAKREGQSWEELIDFIRQDPKASAIHVAAEWSPILIPSTD